METLSYCKLMERCGELETQVKQLAAENAALKAAFSPKEISTVATDIFSDTAILKIDGDEFHSSQWVDNETDVIRALLDFFNPETPATDAILADLRAEVEGPLVKALLTIANSEKIDGDTVVCDFDTLVSVASRALSQYYARQLRSKTEVPS